MSINGFSKEINIGNKLLTEYSPTYIIAEIGVNHNGDMDLAEELISSAKKNGADAAKFQTYNTDSLVTRQTPKVEYQKRGSSAGESHYEMLRKLELTRENHFRLKDFCRKLEIDFISTPYDIDSAKFLKELDIHVFKTASADLVDLPLHNWIAKTGKPCLVSVGMSSLGEIEKVLDIYNQNSNPNVILLHCVSNYPASDKSINMRVLETLKQSFNILTGYSDHSEGCEAAILSLAYGAVVFEKHFTLDKNLPGPDHKASANPIEFKTLVNSIRKAEKMLGSSVKRIQNEESQMAKTSRKSIVMAKDIQKGEIFSMEHLTLKRPGTGLKSEHINYFIGRRAKIKKRKDDLLDFSDVS